MRRILAVTAFVVFFAAGPADALTWYSYGGHDYSLTDNAGTWLEAQAEAESYGGNLVTINDATENAWVFSTEAMTSWRRAIEVDPNHAGAYAALGGALAQQGQPDQAIEQYRKALAISPRDVYLLNALGIALARQGQLDEAISLFERAVAVDPEYEVSRRNLETARRDRDGGR